MMNTYQLATPGLINPHWLYKVQNGRHFCAVNDDQTVTVHGVNLVIQYEADQPRLVAGTQVEVWLNRFFYMATMEDLQKREQERIEAQLRQAEAYKAQRNQLRQEAEAFNATLNVPVCWTAGIKDVLSGLSANSWGDGRNKRTVQHILLQEGLREGRLIRQPGDFLCTSKSGSNGKQYSDQTEEMWTDGDGNAYRAKITCQKCVELAKRWDRK